jgi:hypothetical protein
MQNPAAPAAPDVGGRFLPTWRDDPAASACALEPEALQSPALLITRGSQALHFHSRPYLYLAVGCSNDNGAVLTYSPLRAATAGCDRTPGDTLRLP